MRRTSSSAAALVVIAALLSTVQSFSPVAFLRDSTKSTPSSTVLYISSWGTSGPPHRWGDSATKENPERNVQAYLPEPAAVEARVNIDGTCLVSGVVRSKERTDQFLYDLLNHEESAFEFDKIVAFVDNAAFAKKRLLSRSARYTGLLDKLDIVEASEPGALPELAQLEGVKSWVAYLDDDLLEGVKKVAALAKEAPSVENVAILLANANGLDAAASKEALETLQSDDSLTYTLVAVGELEDTPEGKQAYQFKEFGTEEAVLPAKAKFSRDESYRMITELLQLEAGSNKALAFAEVYNKNVTEVKLVKGLREAGYARPQEIDHMLREGPEAYKKAIEDFKKENPDADKGYTTDAWWEAEEFQKSRRRSTERAEATKLAIQDARNKEIEEIAKEWAKREYFRQSMAGTVPKDQTEDEFVESVWDRAMFEGDLKYRQMNGEATDEESELADFKAQQERKKQTMLKRAKEELQQVLEEDNLGVGDTAVIEKTDEDEDDDDE